MKKIMLSVFSSILYLGTVAQVENHLNNNESPKTTLFRATNKFSLNTSSLIGGLTMGILNGNNASGNPGFINLVENNYLFFGTNNTERVRILNTGQVGIGTSTPMTLFDVNGQATVRTLLLNSMLNRVVVADSNGTLFYRDASDFMGGGGGADSDWLGAGTGQMFAGDVNDRVTIGTTSTTFKFEVFNDFVNNNIATAGFFRTNATGKSGEAAGIRGLVFNGNGVKFGVQGRSINNDASGANNVGVLGSGESIGSSSSNLGVIGQAFGNANMANIGVRALTNPNAPVQMGVQANASGGLITIQNLGIRSIAQTSESGASIAENAGVRAEGWHSPGVVNNYGLRALAITAASGIPGSLLINYGLFATASGSTTGVQRAGFFQGDVEITGAIINPSDKKLKQDIQPLKNALSIVNQLTPTTYEYKPEFYTKMGLARGKQWGFIAQDLQQVLPELVYNSMLPAQTDEAGKEINPAMEYKSVSYIQLIPILVQAIKEQQTLIENTQQQNETLREELAQLKSAIISTEKREGSSSIISTFGDLEQNQPNPFNQATTIKYQLPIHYNEAFIFIYDMSGKQLKKIQLKDKSTEKRVEKGEVKLNANEFLPGIYIYVLIIDTKEVNSKKMIITD
jgi:hypothetical protein